MSKAKVYIDPRTTIEYASFYIHGLYTIFEKKNIIFSIKPFEELRGFEHFLAVKICESSTMKCIIIDFTDSKNIDAQALEWSDVYGKINITQADLKVSSKLLPIGPSFGINIYNTLETLFYAGFNFIKSYKHLDKKKHFLSSYKAQLKRPKLGAYIKGKTEKNYIFFLSSLWKNDTDTNKLRANFITSCKAMNKIQFEGGFVPRRNKDIAGYETHTVASRISTKVYIEKMKRSMIAFNTPAVKGCHGWKLAEFMALGKVIVSTPLSREMPHHLSDNRELLITIGDTHDIEQKLILLIKNEKLRLKLETNARVYFDNFLKPEAVIKRLINFE